MIDSAAYIARNSPTRRWLQWRFELSFLLRTPKESGGWFSWPPSFIECARAGIEPEATDRMTVDDFLAWRPVGSLHQQALEAFGAWVCSAMD